MIKSLFRFDSGIFYFQRACETIDIAVFKNQKILVMKKIIALFTIALISTSAKAQNVEVKSNAFGMIFGAYNVTAEFQLEQNPSITVLVSAWYNTEDFKDWTWTERDGGLSLGARQYFNRFEDQGVFIGLATRYIPNSYTYSQGYWDQYGSWVQQNQSQREMITHRSVSLWVTNTSTTIKSQLTLSLEEVELYMSK